MLIYCSKNRTPIYTTTGRNTHTSYQRHSFHTSGPN